MKKFFQVLLKVLVLVLLMCFGLSFLIGCSCSKLSDGYFTYMHLEDGKVGLTGLTKSGQKQEVLVIPQYIKGKEVISFDDTRPGYLKSKNKWQSSKLKKIFIPFMISSKHNPFEECEALTRTIHVQIPIKAIILLGGAGIDANKNYISRIFTPPTHLFNFTSNSLRPANISYMWNYEGSKDINEGYYWIDDEDYGTKISFIPSTPKREGYVFDGWYKEAECVNEWNFETDTLPQAILEDFTNEFEITAKYPKLQKTVLYAKWSLK